MDSGRIIDDWVEVNPNRGVERGDHESEFSDYEEVTRRESPMGWECFSKVVGDPSAKATPVKGNDPPAVPEGTPPHFIPAKMEASTVQATSPAIVALHLQRKHASQIPKKAPARQSQPTVNGKASQPPRRKKKAPRGPQRRKKTAPVKTQETGSRVVAISPHLRENAGNSDGSEELRASNTRYSEYCNGFPL